MSDNLNDFVRISVTQNTLGVRRAGFGISMFASANATFPERARSYEDLAGVAEDFPSTTGPEYLAAQRYFQQNPHPRKLIIGRCALPPTQKYELSTAQLVDRHPYKITAKGDGVTSEEVSYSTSFEFDDLTVTTVDATDNELDITAHGFESGDGPVRLVGDDLPDGTDDETDYWVIKINTGSISLALSRANSLVPTEVNFVDAGSGTIQVVATTTTSHNPTNDLIVAGLATALNLVTGKNFSASVTPGAGDTDVLIVEGDDTAEWFSLEVQTVDDLKIKQTHTNPGIETDLAAIQNENDEWYGFDTFYNSNAVVLAAAAWAESAKKLYIPVVNESDALTTAISNSDTLDDLRLLAYEYVAGSYHPSPADMFAAGWMGRVFPIPPGGETWAGKTVKGVNPTTLKANHKTNLNARRANYYYTAGGINVTVKGMVGNPTINYIDARRFFDWVEDYLKKGLFEAIAANDKVPYTAQGQAIFENKIRGTMKRGTSRGGIATDPAPLIVFPEIADISDADKADRIMPDVDVGFTYTSAVHEIEVRVTVSL